MSEENVTYTGNVIRVLNEIRKKYVNNVVIGNLNINSLANKFDTLTLIIKDRLGILVLVETKLDDSFTDKQCTIEGYTKLDDSFTDKQCTIEGYTKLDDSFTDKQCTIEGYTKLDDSFTDKQCTIEGYTKLDDSFTDKQCTIEGIQN